MKNCIRKIPAKTFVFWCLFAASAIFITFSVYWGHQLAQQDKIKLNHTPVVFASAPESIKAAAYLVGDLKSGQVFIARNSNYHLFPASLSKLMTGEIAIDNFPLDKQILITPFMVSVEGEEGNLQIGESLTVESLLKMLLISSSNDAAAALSESFSKGSQSFVDLMNEKAKQLALYNTAFFGATGIDRKGNFTTVEDLFTLSRDLYQNYPLLGEITRQPETIVYSVDGKIKHHLKNTNTLAGELPYLWLGKTGSTPDAKDCLLTIFEIPAKDDKMEKIGAAIIILSSTDRFEDTLQLYHWLQDTLVQSGIIAEDRQ